jgi:uncharacterized membrane protein
MTGHHLHVALNHIPVLGLLFGTGILAYGLMRAQDTVVRVALGLLVFSGIGAGAAYLTGESAEERVENVSGIPHAVIEAHEEMGLIAMIVAAVVGALALGVLVRYRSRPIPVVTSAGLLVATVLATGVLGYTANLGGQIRHPELRGDTPTQPGSETGDPEDHDERHDDDDLSGRAPHPAPAPAGGRLVM